MPDSASRLHPFRSFCLSLSLALLVVVSAAWLLRPDAMAAMTVYPPGAWAVTGLFLAALGAQSRVRRPAAIVAGAWLLAVLVLSEEPRSLVRSVWPVPQSSNLTIVSLNCCGGSPDAARTAFELKSDVLLLQETPAEAQVEALTRGFYGAGGEAAVGFDASVVVRGRIGRTRKGPFYTAARARLSNGATVEIVSLRLQTPPVRFDLWNPEAWRTMRANRLLQREQIGEINALLSSVPDDVVIIVGGDFNAVQGDPAPGGLAPHLFDAFAPSGRGWGNTMMQDFPVIRIDQIWLSRHLRPLETTARDAQGSDHRMVVCRVVRVHPR